MEVKKTTLLLENDDQIQVYPETSIDQVDNLQDKLDDINNKIEAKEDKTVINTKISELNNKINTKANATDVDSKLQTIQMDVNTKQDQLYSGLNIKTINSQSILGSGDITISVGGAKIYKHSFSLYTSSLGQGVDIMFYSSQANQLFSTVQTMYQHREKLLHNVIVTPPGTTPATFGVINGITQTSSSIKISVTNGTTGSTIEYANNSLILNYNVNEV